MNDMPLPPQKYDFASVQPPRIEFAFRIRIFFKQRLRFSPTTPRGGRVYVPPAGGDISGPRLQGKVVPYSGADFARGRADGAGELSAHYMLEAADGTPIYIYNRGFLYGRDADGKPVVNRDLLQSQRDVDAGGATRWTIAEDTYFSLTPEFDCPVGPHDWLTRHTILGRGKRIPAPDHTVFDYFIVDPPKNW
ncbi:MAG: DUF3237 domain-containing protein [Gammaproteobacteria bacterium]|nr:DUF3237 domain-containing protein [Gammaproteobacteria bacterium]